MQYLLLERWLRGLRTFAALAESPVQLPASSWQLTTISNNSSGDLTPFSGICEHCTHLVNYQMQKEVIKLYT